MLQILADSLMVATRLEPAQGQARRDRRSGPARRWRWLGWFGIR